MLRICPGLIFVAAAWGQGGDNHLSFEVASVKPSANQAMITRSQGGPGTNDPGRWRITNAELSMLLMRAYDIDYEQLKGPSWMEKTQFDVVANVPPGTTKEQSRRMLQNLLVERFHLQVHHESHSAPVYELTVAKNGPKLKPAAEGSGTDDFIPGSGLGRADRNNFPILPPGRPNVACGNGPDGTHCTYRMVTIGMLAQKLRLPDAADRLVIDKTGLDGRYDFTLYYLRMGSLPPGADDNAPGIEEAVQEQLGLKLTASKATTDVLVIDYAEKMPKEN